MFRRAYRGNHQPPARHHQSGTTLQPIIPERPHPVGSTAKSSFSQWNSFCENQPSSLLNTVSIAESTGCSTAADAVYLVVENASRRSSVLSAYLSRPYVRWRLGIVCLFHTWSPKCFCTGGEPDLICRAKETWARETHLYPTLTFRGSTAILKD